MSDKKSVFVKVVNIILTILLCLIIGISGFVLVFAIGSSCSNSSKADNVAYADSVQDYYIYRGDNFIVPLCGMYYNNARGDIFPSSNGGAINMTLDYLISFVPKQYVIEDDYIRNSYPTDYLPILGVRSYPDFYGSVVPPSWYSYIPRTSVDYIEPCDSLEDNFNNQIVMYEKLDTIKINLVDNGQGGQTFDWSICESALFMMKVDNAYYGGLFFTYKPIFNGNVVKVRYSSSYYNYWKDTYKTDTPAIINTMTLYDNNNNYFEINFITISKPSYYIDTSVMWENRVYYITNDFNNNDYYNNGYNDGYKNAEIDNKINLENEISNSYDKGFSDGYNDGLSDGASSGGFTLDMFLTGALSMLDIKIFGLFSLGNILMVVIGFSLVMFVLKLIAGG